MGLVPIRQPLADRLSVGGEPACIGVNLFDRLLDSTLGGGRRVDGKEVLYFLGFFHVGEVGGGSLDQPRDQETAMIDCNEVVPMVLHELPCLETGEGANKGSTVCPVEEEQLKRYQLPAFGIRSNTGNHKDSVLRPHIGAYGKFKSPLLRRTKGKPHRNRKGSYLWIPAASDR